MMMDVLSPNQARVFRLESARDLLQCACVDCMYLLERMDEARIPIDKYEGSQAQICRHRVRAWTCCLNKRRHFRSDVHAAQQWLFGKYYRERISGPIFPRFRNLGTRPYSSSSSTLRQALHSNNNDYRLHYRNPRILYRCPKTETINSLLNQTWHMLGIADSRRSSCQLNLLRSIGHANVSTARGTPEFCTCAYAAIDSAIVTIRVPFVSDYVILHFEMHYIAHTIW